MDSSKENCSSYKPDIIINLKIYSTESVKRALFDFSGSASATIEIQGDFAKISFSSIGAQIDPNVFQQTVADHQILIETEQKYSTIRQIIIAQAFFPCENIEEIVEVTVEG